MSPVTTFLILAVVCAIAVRLTFGKVLDLKRQVRQARKQWKEVVDFLNLFTRSLATVSEVERAMELVAHYVCDVIGAESLGIFLVSSEQGEGRKTLIGAAFAGMFRPFHETAEIVLSKASYLREHLCKEHIPFGEGILGKVALTRQGILVKDTRTLPEDERPPREVHSLMAVPMMVENQLIGVVCAENCREEGGEFDAESLRLLENLSVQAALASNLITIYAERSEQQRILQELELAREIQQSLLPDEAPEWGEYRVHTFSRPAREVGGDFHDFVQIDDQRLMIVVADASGKGIPACMLMGMCQSFVRSSVQYFQNLEQFLCDLNRYLFQDTDRAHFVTMAVCVVDRERNVCEYARAGHTELLLRAPQAECRTLYPDGPALGLLPDELGVAFETMTVELKPGASLMLFTDGISEALDEEEEEFGVARIEQVWAREDLPPEEMAASLLEEVERFKGNAAQADDQTVVIVSRPA